MTMGRNVFLTGAAGCGKTFLMNKYIEYLKAHGIDVAVTASTGIAATHVNGRTIHSWCCMGIEDRMDGAQIEALKDNEPLYRRIRHAKALIIDEVSMLNANRLDLVDQICKAFRQDMRPFGGMQVILCGDFFQLPPVTARAGDDGRLAAESAAWHSMRLHVCYLEEQHRQDDQRFLKVLNEIRGNTVSDATRAMLSERLHAPTQWSVRPTRLSTHNSGVDEENARELRKLPGDPVVFEMHTKGVPHLVESLKEGCLAPERLALKAGAAVMFVKNNFSEGYANGTLGTVTHFEEERGYPVVATASGGTIIARPERWIIEDGATVLASVSQIPLRLAWAITVHKSQGMSLDCAEVDLRNTFEYGMGYVALSRVRSLEGITLTGLNPMALKVDVQVSALDETLRRQSQEDLAEFLALGAHEQKKRQEAFVRQNKEGAAAEGIFAERF